MTLGQTQPLGCIDNASSSSAANPSPPAQPSITEELRTSITEELRSVRTDIETFSDLQAGFAKRLERDFSQFNSLLRAMVTGGTSTIGGGEGGDEPPAAPALEELPQLPDTDIPSSEQVSREYTEESSRCVAVAGMGSTVPSGGGSGNAGGDEEKSESKALPSGSSAKKPRREI